MNGVFITLALALVALQFVLPRRLAFLPLLVAICHFQAVPVIDVGVKFTVCKLVIMAGIVRAQRERTFRGGTRQPLDLMFGAWAGWMFLSGFAHNPADHNPITIRLSVIFDFFGSYLYARSFIENRDEFLRVVKCLAFLMIPLAAEVLFEKAAHWNIYKYVSGIGLEVEVRQGRVRASGPFSHAILLGTFGASSMILMIPLWQRCRRWAIGGAAACAVIVFCSASSSPIVTLLSGLIGVALWRWRTSLSRIRKLVLLGAVTLHLVMQAPVWYLMARIDLAGGSTGWHRAELITAALEHLGEWWLVGTDYTRHWIAYGVVWSEYHIDITNHYISMGVSGGLPLLLLFIFILIRAFQLLGNGMRLMRQAHDPAEFILWCVGAALFAHSFSFISICYFDQTNVGFGFLLGGIPGLCAVLTAADMDSGGDGEEKQGDSRLPVVS